MKHYKFWVKEPFSIRVGGRLERITVLAGSNVSKDDARSQAGLQARQIESRISSRSARESYEVPVREYVEQFIDDANVITVCRYGAKVLNTCQYTVLDLDDYPVNFLDRFRAVRKLSKKARIVYKFKERLKKHSELGRDFRIYETTKGVRVIGKTYVDPARKHYESLMRKFAVDWLYVLLSQRQNCYRARVTPKPYRMKAPTIKIRSPLDCESDTYLQWQRQYESASENYRVLRFVEAIGRDFSTEPVIRLHDSLCKVDSDRTLA